MIEFIWATQLLDFICQYVSQLLADSFFFFLYVCFSLFKTDFQLSQVLNK